MNNYKLYKILKVGKQKKEYDEDFSHFFIHVPSEWARFNNIKKGDFIKVTIESNRMVSEIHNNRE